MRGFVAAVTLLAVPAGLAAQNADSAALVARARAIHERVMALDTHVDISPSNFTAERNYAQRLSTQVNLPKMEEGGLDAVGSFKTLEKIVPRLQEAGIKVSLFNYITNAYVEAG